MTSIRDRVQAIYAAVLSHAATLGLFDSVNGADPASAPADQSGITAAFWVADIAPAPAASGLDATTARLELAGRVETSAVAEPRDATDPNLLAAVCELLDAFSGDFDLGGLVREVDLLGDHGDPLRARAGWVRYPDGQLARCMNITLPLIVNDLWGQAS